MHGPPPCRVRCCGATRLAPASQLTHGSRALDGAGHTAQATGRNCGCEPQQHRASVGHVEHQIAAGVACLGARHFLPELEGARSILVRLEQVSLGVPRRLLVGQRHG